MTGKAELDFYKGEYRKLKSENEDLRANLDDFTNTLEVRIRSSSVEQYMEFIG